MTRTKIYKKLDWLNRLPTDEAERVFRECSGSQAWARQMAASRHFAMLEQLFEKAEAVWAATGADSAKSWPHVRDRLAHLLER